MEDERLRFVACRLDGEAMAALCREFGISRKTGHKIFNRYKETGLEGLTDRSRRIEDASRDFMKEHGPKLKPRTREEYGRLLNLHIVPQLGSHKLEELTRAQVCRFHAGLAEKPAAANFALAVLSKMMTWATETGRRTAGVSPCEGIKKYRTRKRERFLTTSELSRLGEALAAAETSGSETVHALAAIRLILLTGARRNEVLILRWREVDLERRVLRLSDSKTGEKVIQLGPAAVEVLAGVPRVEGNPYVIVGDKTGHHLVALQNTWERLRATAGLPEVRLHDLRHSFASVAAASGASLPMIGKLLGHSQPQTTQRYAHLADDPVSELNNEVSARNRCGDRVATAQCRIATCRRSDGVVTPLGL